MNIVKFLRTHILENICERPLLKHQKTSGLFLKEVYFCILELSAQFLVVLDIRSTYRQSSYTDLVLIKKKKDITYCQTSFGKWILTVGRINYFCGESINYNLGLTILGN